MSSDVPAEQRVPRAAGLMSDEGFTVDGTLIEALASQKLSAKGWRSRRSWDGFPWPGAHVETDRDARLYRRSRGAESRLPYLGHLLIQNGTG
jgi:hypothetical protein